MTGRADRTARQAIERFLQAAVSPDPGDLADCSSPPSRRTRSAPAGAAATRGVITKEKCTYTYPELS